MRIFQSPNSVYPRQLRLIARPALSEPSRREAWEIRWVNEFGRLIEAGLFLLYRFFLSGEL